MKSPILAWETSIIDKSLRAVMLPWTHNSAPHISQSLRTAGIGPALSLRIVELAGGCDPHFGHCSHGGSSEPPEAYAENIIDRGR